MAERSLKLLLLGDVMIGRGVDCILEHHVPPNLNEIAVKDAREYVRIVEKKGKVPPDHERFAMGPGKYPWGDFLPALEYEQPHARIINLETALTFSEDQEDKWFVHRGHPANAVITLRQAAKIDAASLANNHTGDFGMAGQVETLIAVRNADIVPVGIGMNEQEAYEAKMVTPDVAMIALADKNFMVPITWQATPTSPGMARSLDNTGPEDLKRTLANVAALWQGKESKPLTISSLHVGLNWSHDVDPKHRWFAENVTEPGCDGPHAHIVVCHSSHHVKGIEVTKSGRLICWGLGDTISDYEGTSTGKGFLKGYALAWFPTFNMVGGDWKFSHMRMRAYMVQAMSMHSASDEDTNKLLKVLQDYSKVHDPANHSLSWSTKRDKFGPIIDVHLKERNAVAAPKHVCQCPVQ